MENQCVSFIKLCSYSLVEQNSLMVVHEQASEIRCAYDPLYIYTAQFFKKTENAFLQIKNIWCDTFFIEMK